MKVYVVICYNYSGWGGTRFQDVCIFSTYEKAQEYQKLKCGGKAYDCTKIEEKEVK